MHVTDPACFAERAEYPDARHDNAADRRCQRGFSTYAPRCHANEQREKERGSDDRNRERDDAQDQSKIRNRADESDSADDDDRPARDAQVILFVPLDAFRFIVAPSQQIMCDRRARHQQ